jgi:hypothetical protein
MRWLTRLFGWFDPPTDRQLRFAESLGIKVTKWMSKQELSAAIDKQKAIDPKGAGKAIGRLARGSRRARAIADVIDNGDGADSAAEAAWLKTPEGREVVSLYKRWLRISEDGAYGIVVYQESEAGRIEVDVAFVGGADVDHDAAGCVRVLLDFSLPKVERDRAMGIQCLEWSKSLGWFPAENVLIWHKLPPSFEDVSGCIVDGNASPEDRRSLKRYEAALEKGQKMAREKGLTVSR